MDPCKSEISDRSTWGNCSKLKLYCKNVYNPIVKVTDWEKHGESQPIDVDPYCSTAFNLHYSHYNNLGCDSSRTNYKTTTQEMLEQILTRRRELEINPNKALINFYSNIDETSDNVRKPIICSSPFGADYVTTMQHSFQPPYPYLLKRLSMTEPPYYLHRFLKSDDTGKFMDDNYMQHTQKLQMYKGSKYNSYNPGTGYYTDGTLGDISDIY
ncbi:hypothetical protein NQ315_004865 [Exocentrus adspersus]|uniref:Uncharacterized protein n=1 Tax=Exocentrus adspersus TaxID=1586481 RepID=A0AAV8W451_9CUCU|nr:hypothetical protein NQ315_004865 [Exocentrus adspersus]